MMKNLKYQIKFNFLNLDKSEIRDIKIGCITENEIIDFETNECPRVPQKDERVIINKRVFSIENIINEYRSIDGVVLNTIQIDLVDIKKRENEKDFKRSSEFKRSMDWINAYTSTRPSI